MGDAIDQADSLVYEWDPRGNGKVFMGSFILEQSDDGPFSEEARRATNDVEVIELEGTRVRQDAAIRPREIFGDHQATRAEPHVFLRPIVGKTSFVLPINARKGGVDDNALLVGQEEARRDTNFAILPSTNMRRNLFPPPMMLKSANMTRRLWQMADTENILLVRRPEPSSDDGSVYTLAVLVALNGRDTSDRRNPKAAISAFVDKLNQQHDLNTQSYRTFKSRSVRTTKLAVARRRAAPRAPILAPAALPAPLAIRRPATTTTDGAPGVVVVATPIPRRTNSQVDSPTAVTAEVTPGIATPRIMTPSTLTRQVTSEQRISRGARFSNADIDFEYDQAMGAASTLVLSPTVMPVQEGMRFSGWRQLDLDQVRRPLRFDDLDDDDVNLGGPGRQNNRQSIFKVPDAIIDGPKMMNELYGTVAGIRFGDSYADEARKYVINSIRNIPNDDVPSRTGFIKSDFMTTASKDDNLRSETFYMSREFNILRSRGTPMPEWKFTEEMTMGNDANDNGDNGNNQAVYDGVFVSYAVARPGSEPSYCFARNDIDMPYGHYMGIPLRKTNGMQGSRSVYDFALELLQDRAWRDIVGADYGFDQKTSALVLSVSTVLLSERPHNIFMRSLKKGQAARGSQLVLTEDNLAQYDNVTMSQFLEHGTHAGLYKLAQIAAQDPSTNLPPSMNVESIYSIMADTWNNNGERPDEPLFSVAMTATLVTVAGDF